MNKNIKLNLFTIAELFTIFYYVFSNAGAYYINYPTLFGDIAKIIFLVLIITNLIYEPHKKKSFITTLIFSILIVISSIASSDQELTIILLALLAFKDIDFDKFIKRDLIIRSLLTILAIILYQTGISTSNFDSVGRMAFGMGHPNSFGFMLTMIGIELLYVLKDSKVFFLSYMSAIALLFANNTLCRSRSSMLILIIALICFVLMKLKLNLLKYKPIQFILSNTYLIFTIISVVLVLLYSNSLSIGLKLNDLLSSRLYLASTYFNDYGIKIFGNFIYESSASMNINGKIAYTIDMGFLRMIVKYGVFMWAGFAYMYFKSFKNLFENKKYYEIILSIILLIYGVSESQLFTYRYNTFILLLANGFDYKDDKEINIRPFFISLISIVAICLFAFRNYIFTNSNLIPLNASEQYNLTLGFYEKLHSFDFSLFDFSLGFGSSNLNLLKNGILSPFNLLLFLVKKQWLINAYIYFNTFKIIFSCIFAYLWLSKVCVKKNNAIILSILFSLSGLLISFYGTAFLDTYCLLSLCLFFLERYIINHKVLGVAISLFLISITNVTYVLPIAVLLVIYGLFRYSTLNSKHNILNASLLVVLILLSVVLSGFILIPSLSYIDYTSGDSLVNILSSILTPFNEVSNSNYSIYLSLGSLVLLPSLFSIDDNKLKIKSLLFLLLSFISSLILSSYYGDASYLILTTFYIYLLSIILEKQVNINTSNVILGVVLILILFIIMITHDFDKLDSVYISSELCIIILLILALILSIKKDNKTLIFVIIFEVILSSAYANNLSYYLPLNINYSTINTIKENDKSLYRIIDTSSDDKYVDRYNDTYTLNYSLNNYSNNTPGFSINSSSLNSDQENYINLINSDDYTNYIGSEKNYLSFYNIAGAKYIYSSSINTNNSNLNIDLSNADTPTLATYYKNTIVEGIYYISSLSNPNYLLSVQESSLNDEANVDIEENNSLRSQMWSITFSQDDFVYINNYNSNKMVDVPGGNTEENTNIWQYSTLASYPQQWVLLPNEDGSIRIVTRLDANKCLTVDETNNVVLATYNGSDNQKWSFTSISKGTTTLPSYYTKIDEYDYYVNKYFVELGHVNNNLINADYVASLNTFEIERVLKEFVAVNTSDNTSYNLNDNLTALGDYSYQSPLVKTFDTPISNITLCVLNGGIPSLTIDLYYQGQLIRSEQFYKYNYCNVVISDDELVDQVIVNYNDVNNTGYGIVLYSLKNDDVYEQELYNKKIANSFTNINYKRDYISADITINEDNSFVYTYIPYDDNWTIKVDGQEIEKVKANYGFIGFYLNSGTHNVEFKYQLVNANIGKLLSCLSLVGIALLDIEVYILNKKRK